MHLSMRRLFSVAYIQVEDRWVRSQVAEPHGLVLLLNPLEPTTREVKHKQAKTINQIQQIETPPVAVGRRALR